MRKSSNRQARILAAIGVSLFLAGSAHAEEKDVAEKLYQEALKAMDAGKYDEACQKLEQSQAADAALGTQFELAGCYELAGRPLAAFELFQRVAELAHQSGKGKLEERARSKMGALSLALPRVRLSLAGLPSGAKVSIDGKEHEGREVALEPGAHRVTVQSPTIETWETTFDTKRGATLELALGPFKEKPLYAVPKSVVASETESAGTRTSLAYAGLGFAGLGAVAVGVGLGFGASAASLQSDSKSNGCDPKSRCNDSGTALRNDALDAARVSTIATVVGATLVAGGLSLFFFAPRSKTHAAFMPTQGGGYATVGGSFD